MRGNVRTLDALVLLAALVLAYAPLPADAADVHRPGLGDWGWTIDKKTLAREHKVEVVEDPPPAGAGAAAPADDKRQFLLLHCNAEHTSGFGDRVQGIYQGLALARALGRTLVLSPFAVKQANYEFLMKKVKSLSPEQQIERVRELAMRVDKRTQQWNLRYVPASKWLDVGVLKQQGFDAVEFDEWFGLRGGEVDVALVSDNTTLTGVGDTTGSSWHKWCPSTAGVSGARCSGQRVGARRVTRYGRKVLLRDVRYLGERANRNLLRHKETIYLQRRDPADPSGHIDYADIPRDYSKLEEITHLLRKFEFRRAKTLALDNFCNANVFAPYGRDELGASIWDSPYLCSTCSTLRGVQHVDAPAPQLQLSKAGAVSVGAAKKLPRNKLVAYNLRMWYHHNQIEVNMKKGLNVLLRLVNPASSVLTAIDATAATSADESAPAARVGDFVIAVDGRDTRKLAPAKLSALLKGAKTLKLQTPERISALNCKFFWSVRRAVRFSAGMKAAAAARVQEAGGVEPFVAVHWRHGDIALQHTTFRDEGKHTAHARHMVAAVARGIARLPPKVRDSLRGLYLSTDNFNDNDVQLFFQLVRRKLKLKPFGSGKGQDFVQRMGVDMELSGRAAAMLYSREASYFKRYIHEERALNDLGDETTLRLK